MHRDPTLRRRNALVIPGVLLTLFSLEGMAYAAWFRPDTVECGDGSLVVFAYACRRVGLLLLAPLVVGLALLIIGMLQRSKTTCHLGHGTVATTGLAVLLASTLVPAAATLGLYAMEDPADPFLLTYGGIEYGQVRLLALVTGILGFALVPYALLYAGTARQPSCCREKNCFEPCFCDEPTQAASDDEALLAPTPMLEEPEPVVDVAPEPVPKPMPAQPPAAAMRWTETPAVVEEVSEEAVEDSWPEVRQAEPDEDDEPLAPLEESEESEESVADAPAAKASARTAATKPKAATSKLTKKQLAQRKYAASMKGVRKRAGQASGGKGKISKRGPATKLRRELGLKDGK